MTYSLSLFLIGILGLLIFIFLIRIIFSFLRYPLFLNKLLLLLSLNFKKKGILLSNFDFSVFFLKLYFLFAFFILFLTIYLSMYYIKGIIAIPGYSGMEIINYAIPNGTETNSGSIYPNNPSA